MEEKRTLFYKRRYEKLWPFFALLCILDVVISPSADSVYEIFANLTMLQGLLPNPQISVVGVSWTLAVIFVFYLLFPFFCFLLFSKKRAWLGFIIAGIYNILCQLYFFDEQHVLGNFMERENILYIAICPERCAHSQNCSATSQAYLRLYPSL